MKDKKELSVREQYLKKTKQRNFLIHFAQIAILILFLLIWEYCANKGIIDSFITSQPSKILSTFVELISNDLSKHIWVTVYETILGFLIGTVLGILIAIILWWSDFLAKVSEPYLVVLNSLPKVALRSYYHNLGRCRNWSYNCYGNCNFFNCNYIRKFKWIFTNR